MTAPAFPPTPVGRAFHLVTARRRILVRLSPPRRHRRGCDLGRSTLRHLSANEVRPPLMGFSALFARSSERGFSRARSKCEAAARFQPSCLSGFDLLRCPELSTAVRRATLSNIAVRTPPQGLVASGESAGFLSRHSRSPCFMRSARAGFDERASALAFSTRPGGRVEKLHRRFHRDGQAVRTRALAEPHWSTPKSRSVRPRSA